MTGQHAGGTESPSQEPQPSAPPSEEAISQGSGEAATPGRALPLGTAAPAAAAGAAPGVDRMSLEASLDDVPEPPSHDPEEGSGSSRAESVGRGARQRRGALQMAAA